ncbi:Glycosyltransferase involved in cell wall bisynthesis [Prevotella sp. khp1]|uniref:glycosyltransferase family 4 protein n=1 Tax=Prevotellaceae TaxID=171552 RepID=UPI000884170C|nr:MULTISPECIES: glycosyltransferase family 4 protein [Prevotellaceae]QVJ80400.1 glycosyltransferase family 4 protein [Xylanibacter ruminicola]SDQ22611.1 Glycosyltransferase involved in cell wall bisynthesis [Prevotella sp. khp1]
MKIVITVNSLTKGSGLSKYVYSLCDVLKKDANELHIITTHAEQPEFEEKLFEQDSNIKIHQLHNCSKYGKYFRLVALLRQINADLIINNYHAPSQFVLPLCKRHAKVVHIIHNDTADFYRIASINGKYVDGWITPTPGVRDNFNSYTKSVYADRVTAIAHGVELPSKYKIISGRGDKLEIVFTGVLYEHKGVLTLPNVVKKLEARGVDFHFSIIGKGILRPELESQMAKEIAEGKVELTGVISASEVYQRMANAHIFLYPTQIDSFGLVIAEAMMNGAVPVVSHLKGITDALVDDDVNGCLIENPKDADTFAKRIITLNMDRTKLSEMSQKAAEKAQTSFSLQKFHDNYEQYFKEILSK